MKDLVVLYKSVFWPKVEQGLEITENYAPPSSTPAQMMDTDWQYAPEQSVLFADKHDVMIQAGGNVGFYVQKYAKIFKTVYTFEPLPLSFYCLNLNVTTDNVFKFNCCVGNINECVSMIDETARLGHGGSHVNPNANIDVKTTPTIRIDDLNLQTCDLIALDLEGFELNALLGSIETIIRCKPAIILEDPNCWSCRFNSNKEKIEQFLSSLNYKFVGTVPCNNDYVYKHIV